MAKNRVNPPQEITQGEEEEEAAEEDKGFEELGLDLHLVHALNKKGLEKPTPIEQVAIPLILEGKDVVARAKTGLGKTFAYPLPLRHRLFNESLPKSKLAPSALIFVPTRELCLQRAALAGPPDIVISTPGCIPKCLSNGVLQSKSFSDSLKILVLDHADLLLSYG